MKLTKTNSGNFAKEITITRGGKWRFCGNFGTLEAAQVVEQIHAAKGRQTSLTEEVTSQNQAKKHGVPEGRVFWRLEAYVTRTKQVMTHASAAECIVAGKTPGRCND